MNKWFNKGKNLLPCLYNKLVFAYRKPVYRQMPMINGKIYLVSDKGAVSFGKNVRINSSLGSDPIGGSTRTILFAEPGARIEIGDNVGISNTAIHAAEEVVIENDVMIGGNCKIYDTDFHSVHFAERISKTATQRKKVRICEGAFIGGHVIILKGVTIGARAVVGAGSVVTSSIPADEVWAGNPARFIRKIEDNSR